jgi:hypothetical protein
MRFLLRSTLFFAFAGATLLAHNDADTPGWIPVLEVRGASAARSRVSRDWKLVKGEPIAGIIASGASLCALGQGGAEPLAGPPAPHANVWKISGEYLGEQAGRHEVRITSGFTRRGGQPAAETTTQTLSLREGENVVLDVMHGPVDGGCQVHTVTIDARLTLRASDPALARTLYNADLWLVHTAPNGEQRKEHLITNIDGSASTPFNFSRLSFPVPFLDPRQGDTEAFIKVHGSLRARTRTDGLVDLDVDTNPIIFGAERTDKPSTSSPPPARKTLTLKVEETTAIDFPPPSSGYASLALDNPPTGSGVGGITVGARAGGAGQAATPHGVPVQVSGNRLVVNTSAFFKGHRTQMLVTLRRVR